MIKPELRKASFRNLTLGVAIDAEHIIHLAPWRGGRRAEIGIDILPNDLACRCHFKETAELSFVDQCASVRKALRVRDTVAIKTGRKCLLDSVAERTSYLQRRRTAWPEQ